MAQPLRILLVAAVAASFCNGLAHSEQPASAEARAAGITSCANDPSWTTPQKPFRIYGNTWYVGPHGLGVFLISSPKGHVLIDGGIPGYESLIESNIRALGFALRDVRWILNSHAHCDHAGGIAKLAHDTGAQVVANAADGPLLERGGRDDPEYGDRHPFPPMQVARKIRDGERLQLGDLVLTAHATPGHTKGNTTWTWTSCEGRRCLHMVDVGSLSAPDYQLLGNAKYPGIVADFESSFAANLPCDIALAPHPDMVSFWQRVDKRKHGDADALVDARGCRSYMEGAHESFEAELARQRAAAVSAK